MLTVMSVPADVPKDLNVLVHSVVFTFQIWEKDDVKPKHKLHFMSLYLRESR